MGYSALIASCVGKSNFPNKVLAKVNGKPIIQHTYESVLATGLFEKVIVVTNNDAVSEVIASIGGATYKTTKKYDSSFECMAEAAMMSGEDIFVCIPGDHLRVHAPSVEKLVHLFEGNFGKDIKAASIVRKIQDEDRLHDENVVKVALSLRMYGLYFSHAVIPAVRKEETGFAHFEHINVVAARKDVLLSMLQQPTSPLERTEQIECLRFIEYGIPIRMIIEPYPTVDINSVNDIVAAEAFLQH